MIIPEEHKGEESGEIVTTNPPGRQRNYKARRTREAARVRVVASEVLSYNYGFTGLPRPAALLILLRRGGQGRKPRASHTLLTSSISNEQEDVRSYT
jgi:hypothetical protein